VRLAGEPGAARGEAQAMCYFAGANSIFYGEKLLTAANPSSNADLELLRTLDLAPQAPYSDVPQPASLQACCTKAPQPVSA